MDPKLVILSAGRAGLAARTKTVVDTKHFVDLIPLEFRDVYQFMDVVYAVRNTAFQIPNCVTLARFLYLLRSTINVTGIPDIGFLSPLIKLDEERRYNAIRSLSWDLLEPFNRMLVVLISTPVDTLLSYSLSSKTQVRFTDKQVTIAREDGNLFSFVFRDYQVLEIASEVDRSNIFRIKASSAADLPSTTAILLPELTVPLRLIPGLSDPSLLLDLARQSDILQLY